MLNQRKPHAKPEEADRVQLTHTLIEHAVVSALWVRGFRV